MKKIILMALFIFCFSTPLHAANFVEVYRDDKYLLAIDTSSIEKRDGHIVAWTKYILRGEAKTKEEKRLKTKVDFLMQFSVYNPSKKQSKTLSWFYYSPNREVVDKGSISFSQYEDIIPGTLGELLYDLVTDYYNKTQANQTPPTPPNKVNWDNFMEAATVLACHNYLNIDPQYFDESNPDHILARNMAAIEIKERVEQLQRESK